MIIIIAAIQKDYRGLGKGSELLHKIPQDLKRFKEITHGHPVIMGRKTWESLPEAYRPLPNRTNIVITRNDGYEAQEAIVCTALGQAIEMAKKYDTEIFVIGGAQVYQEALPHADALLLTIIDGSKEADAFFPDFENSFKEIESEGPHQTQKGNEYWFKKYVRK